MIHPLLAVAFSLLITSPAALAADARQMEENKKIVAAFYDAAVNQKDFEKASQYLGARYTQHNPLAADGREGFKGFIGFLKDKFPNNRHRRYFQARERQGGRALGRDPADPGESRQRQRHVLAVPVDVC